MSLYKFPENTNQSVTENGLVVAWRQMRNRLQRSKGNFEDAEIALYLGFNDFMVLYIYTHT